MWDRYRWLVGVTLIVAAMTLREPWMIAVQAAMGGFQIALWVERKWPRYARSRQG